MPSAERKAPLIVLLGPTAVGKTAAAIELATRLEGEIVSADSRLFYRGMDIGTAKPSAEEQRAVPHHLINVAEPDESWSLAQFQEAAYQAIDDIQQRGRLPFLVGGSGQYVRAITEGWTPPELAARPELRQALEAWGEEIGVEKLHARLARIDPGAAARMDRRNLRRIVRALEVIYSTGRRFSEQKGKTEPRYKLIQIGLSRPREQLYARIDARIQAMLAAGWLTEIKGLLEKGYGAEHPSMSAIGYAQLMQHLEGELSLDEAVKLIQRASRAFVRRQANWFKADDANIQWFEAGDTEMVEQIERAIKAGLES